MLYMLSARTKAESQTGGYNDKCVSFEVLLISTANHTHLLTCFCVCFSLYVMSEVEGYFDNTKINICALYTYI